MKNLYLLAICLFFAFSATAQEDQYYDEYSEPAEEPYVEPEPDCFEKYRKAFESRGANVVTDGTYDNVVVVVMKDGNRDCFSGKVNVYNNKMVPSTIKFATENGDFTDAPKTRSLPLLVKDGFSLPYVDETGAEVVVIFPKSLKEKPQNLKKAPAPEID